MMNTASTILDGKAGEFHQSRCCGHRRSSSMPISPLPASVGDSNMQDIKGQEEAHERYGTTMNKAKGFVDLNGLVDAFNQISESLLRPTKILIKLLDSRTAEYAENLSEVNNVKNVTSINESLKTVLKLINIVQGNFDHVLPHMQDILNDYKTIKERTQSRDEMLKTLDKALRLSEARNRALRGELQDLRDENKCLKEKAGQNESILRYLNTGTEEGKGGNREGVRDKWGKRSVGVDNGSDKGLPRIDEGSKGFDSRVKNQADRLPKKSHSVGDITKLGPTGVNLVDCGSNPGVGLQLEAKFGHYQKVLRDNETQLQELMALNKDLVLKINSKESEVMFLNRDLLTHQETLSIYEKSFTSLTRGNSEMDAILRVERTKNIQLNEKLEDAEGYINCITDKIASYEVELKYLRQELKKRGDKF